VLGEYKFPNKSLFNTSATFTKERRKKGFDELLKLISTHPELYSHLLLFLDLQYQFDDDDDNDTLSNLPVSPVAPVSPSSRRNSLRRVLSFASLPSRHLRAARCFLLMHSRLAATVER
jgi:hypothetical protein